jgi:hypothetical protein
VNVDHHFRGRPIERLVSLLLSLVSKVGLPAIDAVNAFRASAISATTPHSVVLVSARRATLANQHTIAVTVKTVFFRNGMTVCGQDAVFARKCGDQRQQRGFRQMKICQ